MRIRGTSKVDPFIINDSLSIFQFLPVNKQTVGLTLRNQTFNPSLRNLILIGAGQSNLCTFIPSLYIPINTAVIDNFNIYDSCSYAITGPVLGTEWRTGPAVPGGYGNALPRLADKLVSGNIFDRVIIAPIAIGGTTASDWQNGSVSDRIRVTMARLASRGYVPGMTGLTFAITWWQGETDNTNGTSQSAYTTSMNAVVSQAAVDGFSGRFFINKQSWISGTVSTAVESAQVALVNNTTIFAGGNLDSLNATYRQSDNTHLNDTGADAAATLVYNAMVASGTPF